MLDPKIKNGIIIVVTLVWATNFVSGLFLKGYEPDQTINAIFMAIVGGLFALGGRGNTGGGSGSHKDTTSPGGAKPKEEESG